MKFLYRKIVVFCLIFIFSASPLIGYAEASRFVDNGDGTVTDNHGGLMWIKDPNFFGNHCKENRKDFFCKLLINKEIAFLPWEKARLAVNMLSLVGHSDWRLPKKEEIEILDKIYRGELKNPFGKIQEMYWTSSPGEKFKTYWMIFPPNGIFDSIDKGSLGFVWPVRDE